MNDIRCGYSGDREADLIAYLYDDLEAGERVAFESHLGTCARCRTELAAFGGVRRQVAHWTPPDFAAVSRRAADVGRQMPAVQSLQADPPSAAARERRWRTVPAWAQAAAAILVLGVAAGIANLDVHYDSRNGLNIRTGWSSAKTTATAANPSNAANTQTTASGSSVLTSANAVSRSDLSALERQLRDEMHTIQQARPAVAASAASNEAEVLRQVKALIDQSERRQQNELALRLASLATEFNSQRQADLRKIDVNLGRFQDATGVEVIRNRQKLDYLLQRVAQQQ
jgi:anti-sigma factor ChrR (cupin superfamily)